MSIDPTGKLPTLRWVFDIAALDIPVPSDLMNMADQEEWLLYIKCLSPAQQLRKFGQALDEFQALWDKTSDVQSLPQAEKIEMYSKWEAAMIVGSIVHDRLKFAIKGYDSLFDSDIDHHTYLLIDFLKSVNSPDVPVWENRRTHYNQIDDKLFSLFLKDANRKFQAAPSGPTPPSP